MDFNGTLENGVELYTCLNPNLSAFCLSLWVRRGSMHEPREAHGLAHFLEHAIFRSISERMGGQLYPTLRRLGLDFDASTYTGYVRFEISGLAGHFDAAADILLMALDVPTMSLEGMRLERLRVQTEIREEASEETADYFANSRVWRGTPLARSIAGTKHATNLIGFQALNEEHARWFSPGNFFFCLTGNAPDAAGFARRLAAIRVTGDAPVIERAPVPEGFFHRDAAVEVQDSAYPWLRFCFDVDTSRHSEMAHIILVDYLLGDLGRLYMELSEYTGLVYDLNDYFERFSNIGCLCFDFEVEPAQLLRAVDVVVDVLNDAKRVDAPDLLDFMAGGAKDDRIKEDYVCTFNNYWGYDNGLRHCGFHSADERRAAYAAVTPAEIAALAREVFTPDNAILCVRGNKRRIDVGAIHSRLLRLG